MTSGAPRLVAELVELGYQPAMPEPDFVAVRYHVEVGSLADDEVEIGFKVPPDFNLTPPSGLLVRPHILPLNQNGGEHPWCGVHPCTTGGINDATWQYWSRPHPDWPSGSRDAQALMEHVRHLFATLPAELRLENAA